MNSKSMSLFKTAVFFLSCAIALRIVDFSIDTIAGIETTRTDGRVLPLGDGYAFLLPSFLMWLVAVTLTLGLFLKLVESGWFDWSE